MNKKISILLQFILIIALVAISFKTAYAQSVDYNPTAKSLSETLTTGEGFRNAWQVSLSLINYATVVFLIAISFVNILNLKIDTYAVRKALPMLILGVIMANLSWFFCLMFIDLAEVITSWISNLSENKNLLYELWNVIASNVANTGTLNDFVNNWFEISTSTLLFLALLPVTGLLTLILIIAFVAVWAIFWIRGYFLMFLIIVSPLAFICISLPATQKLFQQWLSTFLKWVFLGPLIWLMMYFTILINNALFQGGSDKLIGKFLLTIGFTYAAIAVPFALGGSIGGMLMGLTKKASSGIGKRAYKTADGFIGEKLGGSPSSFIKNLGVDKEREALLEESGAAGARQFTKQTRELGRAKISEIAPTIGQFRETPQEAAIKKGVDTDIANRRKDIALSGLSSDDAASTLNERIRSKNLSNKSQLTNEMIAAADGGQLSEQHINAYKEKYQSAADKAFIERLTKANNNNTSKAYSKGNVGHIIPQMTTGPDGKEAIDTKKLYSDSLNEMELAAGDEKGLRQVISSLQKTTRDAQKGSDGKWLKDDNGNIKTTSGAIIRPAVFQAARKLLEDSKSRTGFGPAGKNLLTELDNQGIMLKKGIKINPTAGVKNLLDHDLDEHNKYLSTDLTSKPEFNQVAKVLDSAPVKFDASNDSHNKFLEKHAEIIKNDGAADKLITDIRTEMQKNANTEKSYASYVEQKQASLSDLQGELKRLKRTKEVNEKIAKRKSRMRRKPLT